MAFLLTSHDATIVVRDGRIESVGKNVTAPTAVQVIDIKGRWLYLDLWMPMSTSDLAAARHAVQSERRPYAR